MTAATPTTEFECSPGGSIAAGIRRLNRMFTLLGLSMVIAAIVSWYSGPFFPGLLALAVAAVVLLAWRMSNDLRPRVLILKPGQLAIRTPRQLIEVPIEDAKARALSEEEIAHLEGLASAGGVVAGSGGFDSRMLGEFDLYASDLSRALFIQGVGARLIVTPDEMEEFLRCFARMANSPLLQSSAHD